MKKLGELLVEREWVTRDQLTQALRHQQVFGGRLGTCLLELTLVSEDRLAKALSDQLGVPAVTQEDLRVIGDGLVEMVPAKLACRVRAIPFERFGNALSVAVADPRDLQAQDELSFVTSRRLRIHVAPEVRILEALEKHYSCPAEPRFGRIWDRLNRAKYLWQDEPASGVRRRVDAPPTPSTVRAFSGPEWQPAPPPPLESGVQRIAAATAAATAPPAAARRAATAASPSLAAPVTPAAAPVHTAFVPPDPPSPEPAPAAAAPRRRWLFGRSPKETPAAVVEPAPPAAVAAAPPPPAAASPRAPVAPPPAAAPARPKAVAPPAPMPQTLGGPAAAAVASPAALPQPPPVQAPAPPPVPQAPTPAPLLAAASPAAPSRAPAAAPPSRAAAPYVSPGAPAPPPPPAAAPYAPPPAPVSPPPAAVARPTAAAARPVAPPAPSSPTGLPPAAQRSDRETLPPPPTPTVPAASAPAPPAAAAAEPAESGDTTPMLVPKPVATLADFEQRMAEVEERDDVAHAALSFLSRRFQRSLLFMVRGNTVAAWMGGGEGVDQRLYGEIEVSFDEPSQFLNLREGSRFYRGPLPRLDSHQRLVRSWGGKYPKECLLLPVRIKKRLVAVVYCDGGHEDLAGADVGELQQMATLMARGFEAFMVKRKRS